MHITVKTNKDQLSLSPTNPRDSLHASRERAANKYIVVAECDKFATELS